MTAFMNSILFYVWLNCKKKVLLLLSYSTAYTWILLVGLEAAVGAREMARPVHGSELEFKASIQNFRGAKGTCL